MEVAWPEAHVLGGLAIPQLGADAGGLRERECPRAGPGSGLLSRVVTGSSPVSTSDSSVLQGLMAQRPAHVWYSSSQHFLNPVLWVKSTDAQDTVSYSRNSTPQS